MFETSENHIDSSLPNLGNSLQSLNNNSLNLSPADLTGLNSRRLLTLAGETLINAWQNQTNPTQALVYTAASIFNPNFVTNAQIAFGKTFDISKAEELGADILGGIYGVLPNVKFLSNTEMNGALGAYAKSTDTIYLNSAFLTQNAANPTAIGKVLVEETGHFLDVYASPIDSPGDEGDILARLTNNEEISNEALKALKSEDDRGIVLLSQGSLEVEQAFVSGNSQNNSLYGTSYADSIYGYAGNDYLSGGDGDDSLYGGDGNDVLDGGFGFDFLDGGNGIDQVTYNFYSGGINLNLQTGVVSFPGNSTRTDTVVNIEDVIGSSGNDTILGNTLSNNLIGGNGDDIIRGGDGDDVLDGGFGFDFLDGGNGKDTVSYDFYNEGITLNLRTGIVSFPGNSTLTETVINIEAVIGSRGNDFLTGDSFNNSLNGNSGNDVLDAYGSGLLERDDLLGGLGSDRFILGDVNNTYYARSGSSDLAAIADFRVGEDTIQLRQLSNSVTSSSQAYGYRLITVGNSTEIRLDNNELIAILNGVTGLSLTSSAFQFVGTADLIIQNQNAPSSAAVGSNVSISAYTKNNGLGTAAASTVSYWLSNDISLDNSDIAIGSQSVGSLSAGISGYNPYSFIYNSTWGTGNKYILFQADANGNVTESNELNNLAFAAINISDWYSQNLRDSGISSLTRSLAADGNLSRNDMINIFRDAKDGNIIDAYEFSDLSTIVVNNSRFNMADDVRILSNKIANSDTANTNSGIGNLYAGSSSTQMDNLIGKWFLGNDRPDAYRYNGSTQYTYQYVSGSLFQNSISSDDIHQGDLGDCYLLATLSSLANDKSSYIQKMFIDNGDNTFAVRFYNNGIADYVTVDRYLPTLSDGKAAYAGWGGASYSSLSNELWVALVEKAYAQINESGWIGQDNTNSYQTADPNYSRTKSNSTGINGGNEYKVMSQITALDSRITSNVTQQDAINLVNSNNLVTFGINAKIFGDQYSGGHALAVTSYNSITKKFHLDNPWGSDDLDLTWQDLIKWSSSGWSYTTV